MPEEAIATHDPSGGSGAPGSTPCAVDESGRARVAHPPRRRPGLPRFGGLDHGGDGHGDDAAHGGHGHDGDGHDHGHDHGGHQHVTVTADTDRRYLWGALIVLAVFAVGEAVVALVTNSLALLTDAFHMLSDIAAIAAAIWALRIAARPATARLTFGWRRSEILSALLNGATLIIVGGFLGYEAIRRLFDPPEISGSAVLITALVGVAVNLVATWLLAKANRASLNVEGAYQHVLTDLYAFIGTVIFLAILRRIALRSSLVVPLIGMMLGAVVSALPTYIAVSTNLLQMLGTWFQGSFSAVVRGRYESLWIVAVVVILVWIVADRFTVAGLGKDVATSVGLSYERVVFIGTALVAIAAGVTTVVVGFLPFLGLVVPNLVTMIRGDNLRSNIPWVCLSGAALVLVCDVIGRIIIFPFEIPVSMILGIVGAAVFITLLLRQRSRG